MPLEVVTIPCLSDNYAFLAHDADTGETALIDAPEAAPILSQAEARGWKITRVLLTHHHDDHVAGLPGILARHDAEVVGARSDATRLPKLDLAVSEGDSVKIGNETGHVIDVSGHTIGHVAFHFPASNAAFTADSLMAFGCGRVFEGTMQMMWDSLSKLMAMPVETVIYSGHEYTIGNGRFAQTIDPDNAALISRIKDTEAARAKGDATVPSLLSLELATNPFLRPSDPAIQKNLGMEGAPLHEVFGEIRRRKDRF